jgi:glycerate 2-kinase
MANLKQLARRIFHEALSAIDIRAAIQRKLRPNASFLHGDGFRLDLNNFDKVRVVAMGKAAHAMVEGLQPLLPPELSLEGVVSASTASKNPVPGIRYLVAGHPVPNQESLMAAQSILALLNNRDERTLVIFLLSGGASALVELPLDPAQTLSDVQQFHQALVTCGAPIDAINTIRKHFSAAKGGRLAVAADPATKLTLAVSDVPAARESALASGPTLPDPTTISDAKKVIEDFSLYEKFPPSLRRWLDDGKMPETPKAGDPAFANAYFQLLLGMDDLFHPAHRAAEAEGCVAMCDNATDDWPVAKAAEYLLAQLDDLRRVHPGRRVALIADGEVSSPVTGNGVGGRNAAFVLACVEKIAGRQIGVLSAGTDGIDGNSPAGGAVADGETLTRALAAGMHPQEFFQRSDSHTFFARLDDAIVTGPTGNNLRDLRILIAEP